MTFNVLFKAHICEQTSFFSFSKQCKFTSKSLCIEVIIKKMCLLERHEPVSTLGGG